MVNYWMKKLKRKQPRRMTPPLVLCDEEGFRSIVELGDHLVTSAPNHSARTTAYITFMPGLTIEVRSKCVNKRRITRLIVSRQSDQ
jgi:hypothetical protein